MDLIIHKSKLKKVCFIIFHFSSVPWFPQVFFQEIGDVRGEAIAVQTASNCRLILKDMDGAVATAYQALQLFGQCGDAHGKAMVVKLLRSLGQTDQQLQQATAPKASRADVEPAKVAKTEEQKQREDYMKNIMEEQVVFEYAWVPSETQDPKHFGEKKSVTGARKFFVASELRDRRLLQQLAAARAKRGSKKPYFVNLMNGRLLPSSSLQGAMEACACASVIYDVTKLNNMTPLEVADVAIRLVQALQVIEEPPVAMDVILASTQNIASATGPAFPKELHIYH